MKNTFIRITLTLLYICLLSLSSLADITGNVMDSNGDAIIGATISWQRSKTLTVSDENGNFTTTLQGDDDFLIVRYLGYENDTTYVSDANQDIYIILKANTHTLKEVQVMGYSSTTAKSIAGVLNTDNISSGELLRAACCNLGESFTTNPSVDVSYNDAATGAKQIKLLGLSGKYVQMLTENIPNYRGVAMPFALGYIPGPWMQSIQVSKGASSVKNGYESTTGQINVEFKKPQVTQRSISANVYGATNSKLEVNLDGNIHLSKKLSTALLLHYENLFTNHDSNHDGFLDIPRIQQYNLFNRWAYFSDRYIFQGGFKYLHEQRTSGQAHSSHDDMSTSRYTIGIKSNRYELFAKNAFILDKEKNGNIALILNGTMHDYTSLFGAKPYDVKQWNAYASLMYETDFDSHNSLSTGLSFNYDYYHQPQYGDEREFVPGLYAQYTYKLGDKFTAMAGLRYDHSSLYGSFVTPRLHLKWMPHKIINIRASVGKGYRAVHVLAENNYLLASSRTLRIDSDLRQEDAWNYGLSTALYIPIAGKIMNVNLEYYYTNFSNQVVIDTDSDPHAVSFYNLQGKAYSHSFQAEVTYPFFKGFTLTAAYRLTDSKSTYSGRLLQTPLTSRYKALVSASYKCDLDKWQFDATLQVNGSGRMPTPYTLSDGSASWSETFPTFCMLNFQVTRFFRQFSIYLGGENLTNYKQKNPIIDASNPWGDKFDSTMIWGPMHGIMVYAGIRVHFDKF